MKPGKGMPGSSGKFWGGCGAALAFLCVAAVQAETVVLKSGHTGSGTQFRREGDRLMFLMELRGPDGQARMEPRGVALAEIEKVESPMPGVLKDAAAHLAAGQAAKVLAGLAPAVKAAEAFGELPGSWWPQLVVLQAQTLVALGREQDAAAAGAVLSGSTNPGLASQAKALQALVAARKGEMDTASSLTLSLWKEKERLPPSAVASVAVARGLGFLEKKQFVPALKAFLELPVFLPGETALSGIAQLGAAQAYYGMEDYDRAIEALEALIQTQPGAPETARAQEWLPQWQRRRTAVREAGAS